MNLKKSIKAWSTYVLLVVCIACTEDRVLPIEPNSEPEVPEMSENDKIGEKDLKVEVVSARMVKQDGTLIDEEQIRKTYDGDRSTVSYIGAYNLSYIYEFGEEGKVIDYVVYHPYDVSGGWIGSWGRVSIYLMEAGENEYRHYEDREFSGTALPTTVFFEGHRQVKAIKFLVRDNQTTNDGWSQCSEIEFYRQENPLFDPLILFTDQTCSELKEGVTEQNIKDCSNSLYRNIAQAMYKGTYKCDFRIQEFPACAQPQTHARENRLNGFSLYENVTGIFVDKGEKFIVLVGDMHGESVTLKINDVSVANSSGATFPLRSGFNEMEMPCKGLVYVAYHTQNYKTAKPIKIHFVTGEVNGYFDVTKHTKEQWPSIIGNSVFAFFDMVGRRSHITFSSTDFSQYCDDPFVLMEQYDRLMDLGEELTGLKKYERKLTNKVYVCYNRGSGGAMAAAENVIIWNRNNSYSIPDAVSADMFGLWGVAHELGHELQIRPGRQRYNGMLEVTNNLLPIYAQLKLGEKSRLFTSITTGQGQTFQSEFERAMTYYGAELRPHNYNMKGKRTVLTKLVPYWQLCLYASEVRGEDWFEDYYEELRKSKNNSSNGDAQIDVIRIFCNVSKLNLLEFFEHTGFLTPTDDYTDNGEKDKFTVTQDMIDKLEKEIEAEGYPKPDVQFWRLTDQKENIDAFKQKKSVVAGKASRFGKTFTMTGWQNVAAYEVYTNGKLVFVSPHQNFTVEGAVDESTYVNAVSATGEETKVTFN